MTNSPPDGYTAKETRQKIDRVINPPSIPEIRSRSTRTHHTTIKAKLPPSRRIPSLKIIYGIHYYPGFPAYRYGNMTKFNIAITSDNVCPWCYVGKKKLERGISLYKAAHPTSNDTFTTTWLPFYLNPAAPKVGVDKRSYYKSRFGDEKASMIIERLTAVGKDAGIKFSFGGKTGNTRDSHRLVELGKTKGADVQTRVVEELFKSYFEEEGDITSHDVLREAGVNAGLEEAEVKKWLESDTGGEVVDKEVAQAQIRGISGVPNFVLQGKYEIGGAQDAEAFVKVFERVKEMEQ